VKNFARVCSSARTDQSRRVRQENSDSAAAVSSRAAESGTSRNGAGLFAPAPHRLDIQAMFDSENPGRSGDLAGESYAAVLENHPRYPDLRSVRDAKLLARLDRVVEQNIKRFAALLLPPLGFDEVGIAQYRSAALSAFRAVLPTN
jgi:hypothetical protein